MNSCVHSLSCVFLHGKLCAHALYYVYVIIIIGRGELSADYKDLRGAGLFPRFTLREVFLTCAGYVYHVQRLCDYIIRRFPTCMICVCVRMICRCTTTFMACIAKLHLQYDFWSTSWMRKCVCQCTYSYPVGEVLPVLQHLSPASAASDSAQSHIAVLTHHTNDKVWKYYIC